MKKMAILFGNIKNLLYLCIAIQAKWSLTNERK